MVSNIDSHTISARQLQTKIGSKETFFLIDILPPEHYQEVQIQGAENACVFYVSFLDDIEKIVTNLSDQIVIYGSSRWSHDRVMAYEKLERAGYTNVSVLSGGLEEWLEEQFDVVRGDSASVRDPQTQIETIDGSFAINIEQSQVEWVGRNINTSHFGTVNFQTGSISIDSGEIRGDLVVDMTSIKNVNLQGDDLQPVLESHLSSDDFFFTSLFPTCTLKIKESTKLDSGWLTAPNFHLKNILTLRGVTAELEFDAVVNQPDENSLLIEAHFDLDRTEWGIIYGSSRFFEFLGMHKVFDLISIQLRILAYKAE